MEPGRGRRPPPPPPGAVLGGFGFLGGFTVVWGLLKGFKRVGVLSVLKKGFKRVMGFMGF
jgi:hypothetical protein